MESPSIRSLPESFQERITQAGFTPEQVDVINLLINEEMRHRIVRGDEYFVGDGRYYKVPSWDHFSNQTWELQKNILALDQRVTDILQTVGYARRLIRWFRSLLSRLSSQ